ncbi:MAG: DUF4358 domain-containing protein [Clostridiales Family XIII bacterium]|jgi:hypothetical protein|nr:DUF4358 domain-containing protein [Clostridiales Family XIII bacterium]
MKKTLIIFALTLMLVLTTFSGCSSGGTGDGSTDGTAAATDTLTGDTSGILEDILSGADETLADSDKLPPNFIDPVTADNAQGMLGLSPDEFGEYVSEAYAATGALTTSAYEVALIKCTDFDAAAEVKALVAGGFESGKWICVMPEQSFTVESGSYVLLAVSSKAGGDAILESFTAAADGNVGDADMFYTKS